MINPVDRTQDFIQALCTHHSTTPKTSLTPILKVKPRPKLHQQQQQIKDDFIRRAEHVRTEIMERQRMIDTVRRKYEDYSSYTGMDDSERDKVDSTLSKFLAHALKSIDTLKTQSVMDISNNNESSYSVHKLGIVIILNDQLNHVSKRIEELRACRIRQALKDRQNSHHAIQLNQSIIKEQKSNNLQSQKQQIDGENETEDEDDQLLMQQFQKENMSLVNDFIQTREQVKQVEKTVDTIANMNQVFATKVLEQAKEIETLYDLAVESSRLVGRGNRELNKMHKSGPVAKYLLAALVFFLALTLLLMEWAFRRRIV